MAHAHGRSIEDYLEAIYFLVSPIGEYQAAEGSPANAARVAELLCVSRAAVGAKLSVLDVKPAAGHLTVKLGGGKVAGKRLIAEKAARGLIVRVDA